jgi:transposase-like protein
MRKNYSSKFKAQIVLEMIREEKTVAELASQYGVHPTVLHRWRKQAIENLAQVFENGESVAAIRSECDQKVEQLYTEIGRLTTQLAWLEKKGLRFE